ncbi:PPE family protein [Mycobacterium montefiorense]|nr:PPE family protein [Mycobacterium montefiorense]
MYAGPRSGTMWAAAAAWDTVAAQLGSTASSFQSTVSSLTSGPWQGLAATMMATAATPYVRWLTATSTNAELLAIQTRLSAGAFEAAFTATVPPEIVVANRTLLMTLIATNILGQNTAAIAATEAEHTEMWAQDVTAMTGYDASITAAQAGWTPFSNPPLNLFSVPTLTYISPLQRLFDSLFNSLTQQLMNPMTQLQMLSTPAQFAMEPMQMAMGQLMSGANPLLSGAASVPAMDPFLASTVSPAVGGPGAAQLTGAVMTGGMGRASTIGPLSVPATWANATPAAPQIPAAAGVATAAVSPLSTSLPATPHPPSMNVPGRLMSAAAPAVAAHRAGGPPRRMVD